MNPAACERARKIFDRFAPKGSTHEFTEKSLFEYESDRRFDIVYSGGVLHHVADKKAAFAHKVSFLKPRGFVVLGIGEQFGYFQRHLQREIVYSFSASQADIERTAERFFSHVIDRSVRYGHRERRAVILDNFVNPQIDTPSVGEVLGWFAENGIAYYSAWPPILPGILGNDVRHAVADIRTHPALSFPAQLFWLTHDEDDTVAIERFVADMGALPAALEDLAGLFNNAEPNNRSATDRARDALRAARRAQPTFAPYSGLRDKIGILLDELDHILALLEARDGEGLRRAIMDSRVLFRGTAGLGMNYFVGYKA
jgi:SAM-dependent methyltransferase